jgi:asparagine synthase (glutamine-hydrolysing)
MADLMRHRGPDDEGYLALVRGGDRVVELGGTDSKLPLPPIDGFAGQASLLLGHRRLSVLDLSAAGHQPMANRSGDLWIVYNGEVYNFLELRRELESAGHAFSSDTDTEVVLAAYQEWSEACLERFDGMWAFVILDLRRGVLFGSRDRFGVKPLYLSMKADHLAFGSEIKALIELPWVGRSLDREAAFDFLVLGEMGWSDQTLLEGVVELAPAEAFRLDLRGWALRRWRYYELPVRDPRQPVAADRMERYVGGVRERVRASIHERLRSDVRLGTCLSGGIDSSSIVCVAAEIDPDPSRLAFSASFREPGADERRWAELAARAAGVGWFEVYPQPDDLLEDLGGLALCQDLPFVSPGVYAQHRVMRLAREHGVTVLLDGQGGDELFTGYAPFHDLQLYERLRRLDLAGFAREWAGSDNAPLGRAGTTRALIRRLGRAVLPAWLLAGYRARRRGPFEVFSGDFWEAHAGRWELVRVRELSSLNETLAEMFSGRKLAQLLRYEDRNSMWHSIEARTPFVDDRELVEYVFAIPGSHKIYRGWSKYLLREAMRGIIPDETRERRDKLGFATPARDWMDRLWPELAPTVASEMGEFVDREPGGTDLWRRLSVHGAAGTDMMWRIVSFAVWRRAFGV